MIVTNNNAAAAKATITIVVPYERKKYAKAIRITLAPTQISVMALWDKPRSSKK